ncbi:phage-related capsid packaging protein, partial [Escherichia coli TW15901]
SGKALQHHR